MSKTKEFIFECNKCQYNVYIEKKRVAEMIYLDCPDCGEEAPVFTMVGEGNFDQR